MSRVKQLPYPSAGKKAGKFKEERKQGVTANRFRFSPTKERLLKLKEEDPAAWSALKPQMRMNLGHYAKQKATAAAEGLDVTGGDAA